MVQRLFVRLTARVVAVAALAATVVAGAQSAKPEDVGLSSARLERIRSLVRAHIDAKDFSGAVTVVARKGKVVHFEAHGLADIEANKPMRTDALFGLASMTKPVTAVAVLMLMEEGKLVLSDPVSKFIPEFKNPKVAVWRSPNDPAGAGLTLVPAREITIHDLLTHTAGLANGFVGPAGDYVRSANLPTGGSLDERVRRAAPLPLNFHPGTQWEYSPFTGFDTLGRIIELTSGMTLEQFFQQRIFTPLGMKDTYFTVPASRAGDMAVGYDKTDAGLARPRPAAAAPAPASSARFFSGALGLTGSANDYLAFSQMLLNGGEWNGVRIISRKTVELMSSDAIGDLDLGNYNGDQVLKGYGFGLGVRVRRNNGDNGWLGTVGDFGWAGARGTYFWIDPKEQLVGLFMIQTRNYRVRMEFPNLVYQAIAD